MEEKLNKLYLECISELKSIGIDVLDKKTCGNIYVTISNSSSKKTYGLCIPNSPYITTKYIQKIGRKRYIKYGRYKEYEIRISKWTMNLNDEIIKNTIMHELIHCLPYALNHGAEFKKYASYINQKLGYNISRLGNKKEDYIKSNLEYVESDYKYTIICKNCGKVYKRKRLAKNFISKYRCSACLGRLEILN